MVYVKGFNSKTFLKDDIKSAGKLGALIAFLKSKFRNPYHAFIILFLANKNPLTIAFNYTSFFDGEKWDDQDDLGYQYYYGSEADRSDSFKVNIDPTIDKVDLSDDDNHKYFASFHRFDVNLGKFLYILHT